MTAWMAACRLALVLVALSRARAHTSTIRRGRQTRELPVRSQDCCLVQMLNLASGRVPGPTGRLEPYG